MKTIKNNSKKVVEVVKSTLKKNEKTLMLGALLLASTTSFGQDAFSEGLGSVETSFRTSWWPSIRNIAYILAGVAAVFGLVKVFQQSQRGEDNVSKVAGAWATGLAVFLIGIWAVDTFIINAASA
jgi:hypothetical protein